MGPWSPQGDKGEGPAGRTRSLLAEGSLVWSSLCKTFSKVNAMMAMGKESELLVTRKKSIFLHENMFFSCSHISFCSFFHSLLITRSPGEPLLHPIC